MHFLAVFSILALVSAQHSPTNPRALHNLLHSASASDEPQHSLFAHHSRVESGTAGPRPVGELKSRSIQQRKVRRKRTVCGSTNAQIVAAASATIDSNNSTTSKLTSPATTTTTPASATTTTSTYSSSSTMTSSLAAAATTGSSTFSSSTTLNELFPWGLGSSYWTTCPASSSALSFNSALLPLTFGSLPSQATAPDGTTALVAIYPQGSVDFSLNAGFSFYSAGNHNGVDVTTANEVVFSYSVYFQSGFMFNLGGKLPGLYGGTSLDQAKSCSGGRQTDRDECFSARLMWRKNGMGELYNYYPTSITQPGSYCSTPPLSICSSTYGDSIGRGSFTFATGQWNTVSQRLKLNDVGQANGEQELYVNGVKVISLTQLEIRTQAATKIYGIMAQTFFGGNSAEWSSPQTQSAYFKDWSLAILS